MAVQGPQRQPPLQPTAQQVQTALLLVSSRHPCPQQRSQPRRPPGRLAVATLRRPRLRLPQQLPPLQRQLLPQLPRRHRKEKPPSSCR